VIGVPTLSEAPPLPEGTPLAPGYEVVEHLSRSRSFDVYDVWSETRACRCVAKLLHPAADADADAEERLRREGQLLAAFSHPHLVRAYELLAGPPAIVILETLDGATLSHLIRTRRRRLPALDLAHLGLHLCSAIHYLHGQGVLHLDLKPSNVISDAGRAKVIDLSLARPPGPAPAGIGTHQYLPPEQAAGGELTAASDVWGIGAVLWTAATGERPFAGPERGLGYEQLERRAVRVAARRRLPAPMAAAIDACLEPDPGARPAVGDLADVLEQQV
jgi:serine/threonine protein kinase